MLRVEGDESDGRKLRAYARCATPAAAALVSAQAAVVFTIINLQEEAADVSLAVASAGAVAAGSKRADYLLTPASPAGVFTGTEIALNLDFALAFFLFSSLEQSCLTSLRKYLDKNSATGFQNSQKPLFQRFPPKIT